MKLFIPWRTHSFPFDIGIPVLPDSNIIAFSDIKALHSYTDDMFFDGTKIAILQIETGYCEEVGENQYRLTYDVCRTQVKFYGFYTTGLTCR